jgi:hypothetical protein
MIMTVERDFKGIQLGVDAILNTKTIVRRRRRSASDKKKELFAGLIHSLEEIRIRQSLMYADLSLDFSTYDEKFFAAIDILLHMNFGGKGADVIAFYLYDRLNGDGTVNPLVVNGKHEVILNNPYDLWSFLCQVNPKLNE